MSAGATVLLYVFSASLVTHAVHWFLGGDHLAHGGLRNALAVVQLLVGVAIIAWLALKARRSARTI
jgi:hypothetical protein